MSKRELPLRSKRGKNPFYCDEAEKIQQQKTKITPQPSKKSTIAFVKNEVEKNNKISAQIKRQIYNQNKKKYLFTRGIHYFYDLEKLQRVPQTVSYAFFPTKKQKKISKTNNYTINYSKDTQIIGNTSIGSIINRNIIGLPLHQQTKNQQNNQFQYNQKTLNEVLEMKRNDKNQCHHYLFEAEDKKHNLDRMIAQLEFIYKKVDFFLQSCNQKKLKQFALVEKDAELSQIFFQDCDMTKQNKKELLQQKIQTLKLKRESLNTNYENVSDTYFYDSLNQKLFNKVKFQKQKLNRFNIYQQMQKSMKQHRMSQVNSESSNYNFLQQSQFSRRSEMDEYFCIDGKTFNSFLMENTFKIVSIRLFHQGENCFYFAKKIFSKLFNKELRLQKQIRPMAIEPYRAKIKQIEEILQKFLKRNQKTENFRNFQNTQQINQTTKVTRKCSGLPINGLKKNELRIRANQRIVPIGFYEYYCLKIFTVIYEALQIIEDFMKRSQSKRLDIVQHLASLNYFRFQNRLLSIIQNPRFGLLCIALDKLIEVITHKNKEFETMNYELFVQYDEKNKQILTFVKQIQSSSVQQSSFTLKRQFSVSSILSQNLKSQNIDEEIFGNARKMIK